MTDPLKSAIVLHIKNSYEQKRKVPALRGIIERFKDKGLNFTRFYQIFPGRLSEACKLSGVPVPIKRIKGTAKATETAKMREKPAPPQATASGRLVLSEEQIRRLLGASHLEGGKDPLLIVDELLDRDTAFRKTYKLSLQDTRLIADFLRIATERGWSVSSDPNIVEFLTRLYNCGVQDLPIETVVGLVTILKDLKARNWDPTHFVGEATQAHNAVQWFYQYKAGLITAEQFKQKVA